MQYWFNIARMNEFVFFIHIGIVVLFVLGALRWGKEALIALTALFGVLANLFVLKQTVLFGWNVTCSDVFAVGGILSLNLIQEYFGQDAAKKGVWIAFFSMLVFGVLSQVHLFYAPSPSDFAHEHFAATLAFAPRLLLASLFCFLTVQQIDVRFYGFLKKRWSKAAWQWRSTVSLFATQFLDTALFSFLGLYGIVDSLQDILLFSFAIKCVIIASIAALTSFSKRMVPHEV